LGKRGKVFSLLGLAVVVLGVILYFALTTDSYDSSVIDQASSDLNSDNILSSFINKYSTSTIEFQSEPLKTVSGKKIKYFNVVIDAKSSFDSLSNVQKFNALYNIDSTMIDHGTDIYYCDKKASYCDFDKIIVKSPKKEYTMKFSSDPTDKFTLLVDGKSVLSQQNDQQQTATTSTDTSTDTTDNATLIKTKDGTYWMSLSESDKTSLLSWFISTVSSSDSSALPHPASYYVAALNSFYGSDSTNSTTIFQAMVMIGAMSK
jgi:hypothetical protein